ncbi:MAG TPA: hypothetical protein VG796_20960 [Verrucomicrobiales bacterium]|nr:hypothetical protein [Verrucomicrobiales bacterium]
MSCHAYGILTTRHHIRHPGRVNPTKSNQFKPIKPDLIPTQSARRGIACPSAFLLILILSSSLIREIKPDQAKSNQIKPPVSIRRIGPFQSRSSFAGCLAIAFQSDQIKPHQTNLSLSNSFNPISIFFSPGAT